RMDGDDTCEPSRLEKQLAFLENNPAVSIVGTYLDYIDEQGKVIDERFPFPPPHEAIKEGFRRRNSMAHATTVIRKDKLLAAGGYRTDLSVAQDIELWLRCLSKGLIFANIPEVLYHYRQHGVQNTKTKRKLMYEFSNRAYRDYGKLIWGDNAPDIEFGAPLHRRAVRKLRRLLLKK
ncbi:hypothetical protein KKC97_12235, partial [bacterium]|nr:hypothetical protein [bacterium]